MPKAKGPEKDQLNVRIETELNAQLHQLSKEEDSEFHASIERILRLHVDGKMKGAAGAPSSANLEHITAILADTVARQLKRDSRWAMEVVLQARFHLPGQSVFGDRVGHYSKEKEQISALFTGWLVNRIDEHFLKQGRPVCVVVDGGSTLYWVLRAIGEPLNVLVDRDSAAASKLSFLSINLPGVQAYMGFARTAEQGKDPDDLLSHIVPCHILSGRLEPRYAAVAVTKPCELLAEYKRNHPNTAFLGLVTGNWIRINKKGPSYPIPLWRDPEQGEFKRGLIQICEEVYVVSPLAKVFVKQEIQEVNTRLEGVRKHSHSYQDVPEAHEFSERLRLVSTCRVPNTILHDHSVAVENRLNAQADVPPDQFADVKFDDVPSLLFSFPDLKAEFSREKQLQWECPHKGTDEPGFLKWAYGV